MRAGHKTVRFAKVVERSGQPHVHTLWLPPEKDPELQRAQKAGRVMTVERSASGSKTDVGVVGFDPAGPKNAQFLIFPKSLKTFDGARVIGIKFDLVDQPKVAPAHVPKSVIARARKSHVHSPDAKPPSKPAAHETRVEAAPAGARQSRPTELVSESTEETSASRDVVSRVRHMAAPPRSRSAAAKHPVNRSAPTTLKLSRNAKEKSSETPLIREIRAAMKDLEAGKSVAAYQRLQRAITERE